MRPESPLAAPHLLENVSRYARELGGETALVFVSRGEPDVQLSWAELDLAVRRHLLGPAHPDIARTLSNLGTVEEKRGRLDAAERLADLVAKVAGI